MRRSIVELTAAAVSAADDGPLTMPSTLLSVSPGDMQSMERVIEASGQTTTRPTIDNPVTAPATAIGRIALPDPVDAAGSNAGEIRNPSPAETTTEIAIKIAKDYQAGVFEDIKLSLSAALAYAGALANLRTPAEPAPGSAVDNATGQTVASSEKNILTAFGVAADCRDEVFELMKTNMNATLEYTQQLANVRTPSQFVELSGTHARKQCELVIKQTRELRSLAQSLAKPGAK